MHLGPLSVLVSIVVRGLDRCKSLVISQRFLWCASSIDQQVQSYTTGIVRKSSAGCSLMLEEHRSRSSTLPLADWEQELEIRCREDFPLATHMDEMSAPTGISDTRLVHSTDKNGSVSES